MLTAALVVALGVGSVAWSSGGAPASAGERPPGCPDEWVVDSTGTCRPVAELPAEQGGDGGDGGEDGGDTPGGPTTPTTLDPDRCEWNTYDDQARWREVFPEAPEDAIFGEERCFRDGQPIYGPYVPEWIVPDDAASGPNPDDVAVILWARVAATLEVPQVEVSPPAGAPTLTGLPVFVAVENWQERQQISDCVEGVCLTLTATPRLHLDPAEPGSDTIDCEAGGTRYDPDGPPATEQAGRTGACAHIYEMRTGVPGRPPAWEAEVWTTWEVTWEGAGQSGTIGPISMEAPPLAVRVGEVNSVVVETA